MVLLKKLEVLKSLPGYLGAGVYTPEGKMLGGVTDVSGINFEIAGSLFHDAFLMINNNSREAGFGYINMVQVNTEMGKVFAQCYKEADVHFHTILVIKNDANVARAKMMLNKAVTTLIEDFK
ncbi:MAG: hypothetical protein GY765_11680 [bacterium]|nr:hypothetical protein [bacterium]